MRRKIKSPQLPPSKAAKTALGKALAEYSGILRLFFGQALQERQIDRLSEN